MTQKWTNAVLSNLFLGQAQDTSTFEIEQKIVASTKPVVRFFENLGFTPSTIRDITAYLSIPNGRINLHATESPQTADGQHFDSIIIGLSLEMNGTDQQDHHLNIGISLNAWGQGQYELLNGTFPSVISGDPRKVVGEFINRTEGQLNKLLLPVVNKVYGQDGLAGFKPFLK